MASESRKKDGRLDHQYGPNMENPMGRLCPLDSPVQGALDKIVLICLGKKLSWGKN